MGWLRIVASYWRERPWRGLGILALVISTAAYAGIVVHGQLVDASLENLGSDPTAHTGRVYFNTASGTAKLYNGTVWTGLGSGGAGAKNYVQNGYAGAGWASSSINISCNTVSSNLPDGTVGTALAVVATANGRDTCSYPFDLDAADANKKFSVQFDMNPIAGYAAGDMRVDICTCPVAWTNGICNSGGLSAAGCPPNSTRVVLSTDSSSVSALPNLTGSYRTTFDTSVSGTHYAMMIGLATTNTHTLNVSQLYAGPGVVTQGAAVTQWVSYTPTVNNDTGLSAGTSQYYWRRVGESMEIQFLYGSFGGDGTSASSWSFSLPTGYTNNLANASGNPAVGWAELRRVSGTTAPAGWLTWLNSSSVIAVIAADATPAAAIGTAFGTSTGRISTVHGHVIIPIAEWAGSGTVNVVSQGPEWACNDGSGGTTASTNYTSGSVAGPAGCSFPNAAISATNATTKTGYDVNWVRPKASGDHVVIEISTGGTGTDWVPLGENNTAILSTAQGAIQVGMWAQDQSTTTTRVFFSNAGRTTTTTYGTQAGNWGSDLTGWKWRLKKFTGDSAVGFSNVTQTAAGLVQSAGQLLGTNTNDTANAGNVGEFISATAGSTVAPGSTTAYKTLASISLTAGDWDVSGAIAFTGGVTPPSNMTYIAGAISKNNNATDASNAGGYIDVFVSTTNLNSADFYTPVGTRRISLSATTTIYLTGAINYTAVNTGLWKSDCFIQARRVR